MCVIIHQKKDKRQVTREEFESSWYSNPHGFGMMYMHNGAVRTYKSMNMNEAYAEYNKISTDFMDETDFVLHFRFSTHWSIGISNTHPFHCGNGKYLVHNGVLGYSSTKPWEEDFSDTRLLAKTLETIDGENTWNNWLDNEVVCDFVNSVCTWDKILVMDTNGEVHYFGKKGVCSPCGELWASNESPFEYTTYITGGDEYGFYENGEYITAKAWCEREGMPYNREEWGL